MKPEMGLKVHVDKANKPKIDVLWDQYLVACELSERPDRKRAAHWFVKALAAENQLRAKLGLIKIGTL